MSEQIKRGISLSLSAVAYGVLAVEAFGFIDIGSMWGLITGVVGFVATFYGIEFVKPAREE